MEFNISLGYHQGGLGAENYNDDDLTIQRIKKKDLFLFGRVFC